MNDCADPAELRAYLAAHPETRFIEALHVDAHGILRGKRVGRNEFETLFREGVKVCRAATLLDVKGATVDELGLGSVDGDPDCIARPVSGTLAPVPWLASATAQVLMSLEELDGSPCGVDPRRILGSVSRHLASEGLHIKIAAELEFYLVEQTEQGELKPRLPHLSGLGRRQDGVQYAMTEELWELDGFFSGVQAACEMQGLPGGAVLAEFASGQYEINLGHVDDALLACDHAVLLKRAIKGVAGQHGLAVTFMAKPFAAQVGSGLHIHLSLYDAAGRNLFADPHGAGPPAHSATLRHAIGGLAATMAEAMAIFAPNANSYRRLVPGAYVPLTPSWGFNHRSVSLRIPLSDAANMRIEHRCAGADANPYLVGACVLAGIHHGLSMRLEPPTPMLDCGAPLGEQPISLPYRWDAALQRFREAAVLRDYLGEPWCTHYETNRRSECERFHAEISDRDFSWYLRSV